MLRRYSYNYYYISLILFLLLFYKYGRQSFVVLPLYLNLTNEFFQSLLFRPNMTIKNQNFSFHQIGSLFFFSIYPAIAYSIRHQIRSSTDNNKIPIPIKQDVEPSAPSIYLKTSPIFLRSRTNKRG